MNNRYTSDPTLCSNSAELKLLLRSFGPFTGRYHISYPRRWEKDVIKHMASCTNDTERKKAEELIIRAKIDKSLVAERLNIPNGIKEWNYSLSWFENFKYLHNKFNLFNGALLHKLDKEVNLTTYTLEDLPFSSFDDKHVPCEVSDLVQVSEFMLLQHPEIVITDRYLDLGRKDRRKIVEEMLKLASNGNCESVKIFAWADEVDVDRAKRALNQIRTGLSKKISISYFLINDKKEKHEIHGRHLFSINGGIYIDRGFQVLKGQETPVMPIGKTVLDQLVRTFLDDFDSLTVVHRL